MRNSRKNSTHCWTLFLSGSKSYGSFLANRFARLGASWIFNCSIGHYCIFVDGIAQVGLAREAVFGAKLLVLISWITSPAIGSDGTFSIGSDDNKVYAFGGGQTNANVQS